MLKKMIALTIGSLLASSSVLAAIKTELVEYTVNDKKMEGYLAYDDAKKAPLPGILIVPDRNGLLQFDKDKAEQLAKQGYAAFAVDMYGKGVRPRDAKEAAEFTVPFSKNRQLMRADVLAGFNKFISMPVVDAKKVLVIGYCFGGTTALELARTGVPLIGTAVFHGGLSNPTPEDSKNIKGSLLVMNGADDPSSPPTLVASFKDEMEKAHVDLTLIAYKGAVHAFTHPSAGNDNSKGAAYNAEADKKSWEDFETFLKKIFK
jgi:dienelactone hydrolase